MNEPPCGFKAKYHRPSLYRYQVADRGLRLIWNDYTAQGRQSARIGVALTVGRYAYCVKWADATVVPL